MALTQSYHGTMFGFFSNIAKGLTHWFARLTEDNWRLHEAKRLQSCSDATLADKGLKREDVVRHVFRDVYWM